MAGSTSTVTISRHSGNSGMTSSWRNRAISDYVRFANYLRLTRPKVLQGRNWRPAAGNGVCRRVGGLIPHYRCQGIDFALPSPRKNASGRERTDDTEDSRRPVSPLFAQERSANRQAPQPRHLSHARGGRTSRAGRTVFQAGPRMRTARARANRTSAHRPRTWVRQVQETSDAMDLPLGIFKRSPDA